MKRIHDDHKHLSGLTYDQGCLACDGILTLLAHAEGVPMPAFWLTEWEMLYQDCSLALDVLYPGR